MKQERTTLTPAVVMEHRWSKCIDQLRAYGAKVDDPSTVFWESEDEEKEVPIASAIEAWLLKEHNIKLYSADKAALSVSLKHAIIAPNHAIEVNDDFMWNPGDFGDEGCSYWRGWRDSWARLHKLGGYAMKVYDHTGKGVARCFVLPGPDNVPILFNARGYDMDRMVALYMTAFGPVSSKTTSIALAVGGMENTAFGVEDYAVLLCDSDVQVAVFDGSELFNESRGIFHIFCEMCYTTLSYRPRRRIGFSGLGRAHICTSCEHSFDPLSTRWKGVCIEVHDPFREEEDPAPEGRAGDGVAHERGSYMDYGFVYGAYADVAREWRDDILQGTVDPLVRRALAKSLRSSYSSRDINAAFVQLVEHYLPLNHHTLSWLQSRAAFSEVLCLLRLEAVAGRVSIIGDMLTAITRRGQDVTLLRLAYLSKWWDGEAGSVPLLLDSSTTRLVNALVAPSVATWTDEEKETWSNLSGAERVSRLAGYVRDGIRIFPEENQEGLAL